MGVRERLIDFFNSYALINELAEDEGLKVNFRNAMDMDIIQITGPTKKGYLNMEVVHYLKNRVDSDGMTVKFKFSNDTFTPGEITGVRSAIRNAIYRKDVFTAKDDEIINLYVQNVEEFLKFFTTEVLGENLNEVLGN